MHIRTFFDLISSLPPSPYKLALFDDDTPAEAARDILETFLADPALDHYYARLFAPWLHQADERNYVLAALNNFGVHQLTMRTSGSESRQQFVQVGALDGHEFVLGMVQNVHVPGVLITAGREVAAPRTLATAVATSFSDRPTYFDGEFAAFLADGPCIGLLSLVNLSSVTEYVRTLLAAWSHLATHADIIVQGCPQHVEPAMQLLHREIPGLPISMARFEHWREPARPSTQTIAVLPRHPHDYPSISRGQPRYS